jgi:hypothetical protein
MKIDVSKEEYDAICFAKDLVENDYSVEGNCHFIRLLDLVSKCEIELAREQMRESLWEEAKRLNPDRKPREIKKLVNSAMKLLGP